MTEASARLPGSGRPIGFAYLAERRDLLPVLTRWFEAEWPDYYGLAGPGNAGQDLQTYANRDVLPVGLVAFHEGVPCGFAVLKSEPFPSHPQLFPWIGAAFVQPQLRRQGIGALLIEAMEREAMRFGFRKVYCATGTAASLLERRGWRVLTQVIHQDQPVAIYEKALQACDGL